MTCVGGKATLLLNYDTVQSGAQSCFDITEKHTVEIKAGTIVEGSAKYKITNGKTFTVKTTSVTEGTGDGTGTGTETQYQQLTLGAITGDAQDAATRYLVYLGVDYTDAEWADIKIYVDGVEKTTTLTAVGGKATLLLKYDTVQSGAKSCFDITKEHTIVIKKGTIIAGKETYQTANAKAFKVKETSVVEVDVVGSKSQQTGEYVSPVNVVMYVIAGVYILTILYALKRRREIGR